jgi:hypothetical protein
VSPRYRKRKKYISHGLKDVVQRELGIELDKEHQKASTPTRSSSRTMATAPPRSRRPAKDRSATTSWRCQLRTT